MNITAKSRYALKIMMDLTNYAGSGCQQRQKIAGRHGIPVDFMDHILARLRAAGLIESIRGRAGGFQLKQDPDHITLWDIFYSVEDSIYPVRCIGEGVHCEAEHFCISHDVWDDVYATIRESLRSKTLSEIVADWRTRGAHAPPPRFHWPECRGPSRASRT